MTENISNPDATSTPVAEFRQPRHDDLRIAMGEATDDTDWREAMLV